MPFNKIKGVLFNNNNIISNSNIVIKTKYGVNHTKIIVKSTNDIKIIPNFRTKEFNALVSDIEIGKFIERNSSTRINSRINEYVFGNKFMLKNQYEHFISLSHTISKMTSHVVISEKADGKLFMATQTTKSSSFKYYSEAENKFLISNTLKIKEGSYLSNLKYSVNLTENFCLESIKDDDSLMNYYEYTDMELLQIKINIFKKIGIVVDISTLVRSKFIILPYIYDVVHQNYINKVIDEVKWLEFKKYYNTEVKDLNLEDLNLEDLRLTNLDFTNNEE